MTTTRSWTLIVGLVIAGLVELPAAATTLYVANNGDDNPVMATCGSKAKPCRSISKAITNATGGETIIVGPGRYGDLDGSGTIGDSAGEEAAETPGGCHCMIKVDKPVTIVSRDGALATVLDASANTLINAVVDIQVGGVFGRRNAGFLLTQGEVSGLLVEAGGSAQVAAGNIAVGSGGGFEIDGNGCTLNDNWAINNAGDGFDVIGGSNVLHHNVASGNSYSGFFIESTPSGGNTLHHNVASGNGYDGFQLSILTPYTTSVPFDRNAAVGNLHSGISIALDPSASVGNYLVEVTHLNIFGNGGATNCGLRLANNLAPATLGAITSESFWGAPGGPGSNPADAAGGVCNSGTGSFSFVDGDPVATEFSIKPRTLR